MGLKEQIKAAKTAGEVSSLLSKGESYKQASEKTKRQWAKLARTKK